MNEVTVSVTPVVPPHPGGSLPCVKGLEPAMRLQQLNLQELSTASRAVRCQQGLILPFGPRRRILLR
jgi:hypothetical protein